MVTLAEIKEQNPSLQALTDKELISEIKKVHYPDISLSKVKEVFGYQEEASLATPIKAIGQEMEKLAPNLIGGTATLLQTRLEPLAEKNEDIVRIEKTKVLQGLEEWSKQYKSLIPISDKEKESFWLYTVPSAFGSTARFAVEALVFKGASLPAMGADIFGETYRDISIEHPEWDDKKRIGYSAMQAVPQAILEQWGTNIILDPFLNTGKRSIKDLVLKGSLYKGFANNVAKTYVTEAVQEGSQQMASNVVDKLYKLDRGLFDGVLESALVGGIVGGTVGGAGSIFQAQPVKQFQTELEARGFTQGEIKELNRVFSKQMNQEIELNPEGFTEALGVLNKMKEANTLDGQARQKAMDRLKSQGMKEADAIDVVSNINNMDILNLQDELFELENEETIAEYKELKNLRVLDIASVSNITIEEAESALNLNEAMIKAHALVQGKTMADILRTYKFVKGEEYNDTIDNMVKNVNEKVDVDITDAVMRFTRQETERQSNTLGYWIGKRVEYEGVTGKLKIDEEGNIEVGEYRLPTKELDADMTELGVKPREVSFKITEEKNNDVIDIAGTKYKIKDKFQKKILSKLIVADENGKEKGYSNKKFIDDVEIARGKKEVDKQQVKSKEEELYEEWIADELLEKLTQVNPDETYLLNLTIGKFYDKATQGVLDAIENNKEVSEKNLLITIDKLNDSYQLLKKGNYKSKEAKTLEKILLNQMEVLRNEYSKQGTSSIVTQRGTVGSFKDFSVSVKEYVRSIQEKEVYKDIALLMMPDIEAWRKGEKYVIQDDVNQTLEYMGSKRKVEPWIDSLLSISEDYDQQELKRLAKKVIDGKQLEKTEPTKWEAMLKAWGGKDGAYDRYVYDYLSKTNEYIANQDKLKNDWFNAVRKDKEIATSVYKSSPDDVINGLREYGITDVTDEYYISLLEEAEKVVGKTNELFQREIETIRELQKQEQELKQEATDPLIAEAQKKTNDNMTNAKKGTGMDIYKKYIELVPIDELERMKEHSRGSRTSERENIEELKKLIQEQGVLDPLIIDYSQNTKEAYLTEGNHRLVVAKELGMTSLPARVIRSREIYSKNKVKVKGVEPDQYGYVMGDMKPSDIGIKTVSQELRQELYSKRTGKTKGSFIELTDGTRLIKLFEGADIGTLIHELSHSWASMMTEKQLKPIMDMAGIKTLSKVEKRRIINGKIEFMSDYQIVQETFADAFTDNYMYEGIAPVPEAQSLFDQFKDWLVSLYENIGRVKMELSPEVKAMFDSLLSDGWIAENKKNIKTTNEAIELYQKEIEDIKIKREDLISKIRKGTSHKGDVRANTRELIRQVQQELVDYINTFSFSQDEKGIFISNLKRTLSEKSLQREIKKVTDKAKARIEQRLRQNYKSLIDKEVARKFMVKAGQQNKGKYDYETNTFFKNIRDYSRLNKADAEKLLDSLPTTTMATDNLARTERAFLFYKAYPDQASIVVLKDLLENLKFIRAEGIASKSEADFLIRADRNTLVEESVVSMRDNKLARNALTRFFTSEYAKGMGNIKTFLSATVGKDIADKLNTEYEESKKETGIFETEESMKASIKEIYGLKSDFEYGKKMVDLSKEEYEIKDNKNVPEKLSIFKIMHIYLGVQNEKVRNKYNYFFADQSTEVYGELDVELPKQIVDVLNLLTEEDIAFADMLQEIVQSYYDEFNAVHIRTHGVDLGRPENYFPMRSETEQELYDDIKRQGETVSAENDRAGFTKPIPSNAFHLADKYIRDAEHKINISEKYVELKKIINSKHAVMLDKDNSTTLERYMTELYGEFAYKTLNNLVDSISLNQNIQVENSMEKYFGWLLTNWTVAKIASPMVGMKQVTATTNYMEAMPAGQWLGGLTKTLANPKGTVDYMFNHPLVGSFLKERFNVGNNEALIQILKEADYKGLLSSKWTRLMTLSTRTGDIVSVIFGGKPYLDYLEKNYTPEEAKKLFIEQTLGTMQSGLQSSTSLFQQKAKGSPFVRAYTVFFNTNMQYMRKWVDASYQLYRGEITTQQFMKVATNYLLIQPALFTALGLLSKALIYGDDFDDQDWASELLISIMVSPFGGIPIFIDLLRAGARKVTGKKVWEIFNTGVMGDMEDLFRPLLKNEWTVEDMYKQLAISAELTTKAPATWVKRTVEKNISRFSE